MLGLLPPQAHATGDFCLLINKFFDSFNGTEHVADPEAEDFKCALSDSSPHWKLLDEMLDEMEYWDFRGGDSVVVIRNWRMTIPAFKILWEDLRAEGHLYLPVGHVKQDPEEKFVLRHAL